MRDVRAATTLTGPRRCPWCASLIGWRDDYAWRAYGTCRQCVDLERLIHGAYGRPMRDELRQAVKRR